jgi:intein-encoded DNA endonuclease-like protein
MSVGQKAWNKIEFLDFEVVEIIEHYKTKNTKEIGNLFNCSHVTIGKLLKINGVKLIRKNTKKILKYSLKIDYFESIDTEKKAYYLGLLYADGNISNDNNKMSISLKGEDTLLLFDFKKELGYGGKLYFSNQKLNGKLYSKTTLQISSKTFCSHLIKNGCHSKKSLILKFPTPEQVPEHLIHHFIRGYFDGDGCIYTNKNRITLNIAGTENVVNNIKQIFDTNLNVKCSVLTAKTKNTIYLLELYCNNSVKAFNFLYESCSICLNRKFAKFEQYKKLKNGG